MRDCRQRVLAILVLAGTVAMVAGCDTSAPECPPEAVTATDLAIETAGLALPRPLPLDLSRIDVETVGTHYEGPVRYLADVLRGDWAQAHRYWESLAAIEDPAERMRQVYRLKFAIQGRGLYFLHAAQEWLAAEPQAPAARLLMGVALADAAVEARGSAYSSKVAPAQMALFRQRFQRARPYLEGVAAGGDVHAWLAHAYLQLPYFFLGEREKGWASIEYLIGQAPQYGWLYFWATEYAKPKWAGPQGPDRLERLAQLAASHGLNASEREVLARELAYVQDDMDHQTDPQAWRPYWSNRQAEAPHLYNLLNWLAQEHAVENWPDVERLASEALTLNPHQTYSLHLRSLARKAMGRNDEALRDTLAAAVLGNDDAMRNLIHAHLQGSLGRTPGDHAGLLAYCKMGAAFGLPSAANCIASMYVDGVAGMPSDPRQGVAWHLLAARAGHVNSQHDVGVVLPKVDPGEPSRRTADYWMREAARQGHPYARNKLGVGAGNPSPRSVACGSDAPWSWLAQKLADLWPLR